MVEENVMSIKLSPNIILLQLLPECNFVLSLCFIRISTCGNFEGFVNYVDKMTLLFMCWQDINTRASVLSASITSRSTYYQN
jgi:hypothetical protein